MPSCPLCGTDDKDQPDRNGERKPKFDRDKFEASLKFSLVNGLDWSNPSQDTEHGWLPSEAFLNALVLLVLTDVELRLEADNE